MIIHTVQPNETIESIADMYDVSVDRLIIDNKLMTPVRLVVGQALAILTPKETYQVQEGDTLASIADSHGVSVMQLLRNNPQLANREYIYPGEELVISYTDEKIMELSTNGYALPFIDIRVLRKTLPYLTYLTIFYYQFTMDGELVDIDDQKLINTARAYCVAPIMLISALNEDMTTDVKAAHNILINKDAQENLINHVLEKVIAKDYYGINIDMQDIAQEDKQLFIEFIRNITNRVKQAGYSAFITLTPDTFPIETGLLYQGPEYSTLGQLTDSTLLLSYEWGHLHRPRPALPLANVTELLDYAVTQIPPTEINIGIPIIGYIWPLPFIPDTSIANAITHTSAISLAGDVGAVIIHDPATEAPYFTYGNDEEFIVWFRDARNFSALMAIVVEYGLEGIGTWNIMQFTSEMWMIINAQFDIRKVL